MSGKSGKKVNRKRFIYSIMPLLLTIAVIVTLNLMNQPARTVQTATENSVAAPTQLSITSATPTRPPILQATILPSPTPTITPLPTLPTGAAIDLVGPPDESILPTNGRITFIWTYSEPLEPGQELVFTLQHNDTILATSSLTRPNFGNAYQISLDVSELAEVETAVWHVHLQWKMEKVPLVRSENRTMTIPQN